MATSATLRRLKHEHLILGVTAFWHAQEISRT
jgi:hypothetical protein